jgi:hypothetical protein
MAVHENLGSFFDENKTVFTDYIETRFEIYRLQTIRFASKAIGYLAWIILSFFLGTMVLVFTGLVIGFWFTQLTGSYVLGFGLATMLLLLIIILMAVFRNSLFVNPVMRNFVKRTASEETEENNSPDE